MNNNYITTDLFDDLEEISRQSRNLYAILMIFQRAVEKEYETLGNAMQIIVDEQYAFADLCNDVFKCYLTALEKQKSEEKC